MAACFPGANNLLPSVTYATVMTRKNCYSFAPEETPEVWTPESIDELNGELPEELPDGFVEGIEPVNGMLLFIKKDIVVRGAKFPGVMYQYEDGKWMKCACRKCGLPGTTILGYCSKCGDSPAYNEEKS